MPDKKSSKAVFILTLLVAVFAFLGFITKEETRESLAFKLPEGENLIANPSFEESVRGEITSNEGVAVLEPLNWTSNSWGDNDSAFEYPAIGVDGKNAAKVLITEYTDGDAKWYFDDVEVNGNSVYTLGHFYKATVDTNETLRFTMKDGTFVYTGLGVLEPTLKWKTSYRTIIVPKDAVSITLLHTLGSAGELHIDDFILIEGTANVFDKGKVSFTFDDGWLSHYEKVLPILNEAQVKGVFYIVSNEMLGATSTNAYTDQKETYATLKQVIEIRESGHEIGSHTLTHASLSEIPRNQAIDEVSDSKLALLRAGLGPIDTIAYPYGSFNDEVMETVFKEGYVGARTVKRGFNNTMTDKYTLLIQQIDRETTLQDVEEWIEQARANKLWLILMFHQVGDIAEQELGVSEELFSEFVQAAVSSDVDIITVAEGIALMDEINAQ